jgi:hypothetical protein
MTAFYRVGKLKIEVGKVENNSHVGRWVGIVDEISQVEVDLGNLEIQNLKHNYLIHYHINQKIFINNIYNAD